MKRVWRNRLLLPLALATLTLCYGAPAWAADCGDTTGPGDVPCSCGDTVTTNTTLGPGDPVTTTVCGLEGGLIVDPGVVLDGGGRTIRGTCGDLVTGIELGEGSTVKNLRVIGFDIGISGSSTGTASVCHVLDSCLRGMNFDGNGNLLEKNIVLRTDAQGGINVSGDENRVILNRVEDSAVGILAGGNHNLVSRNLVYRSGSSGIDISGEHATLSLNQVKFTAGTGVTFAGSGHSVSRNMSNSNEGDGFDVSAVDSTFSQNTTSYNTGFGIRDGTTGTGTAGTANTYTRNICRGNGAGGSSPAGLCQ